MNSPYIAALLQACALLPQYGHRSYGKLLCVLVFVKAWSASWRSQAAKWQGYAPAKKANAMAAAGQLNMTEQTLLDALLPADANNILTPEAAQDLLTRLCATLNQLAVANPSLHNVFQSWHLIHLQSAYTLANASPDTLGNVFSGVSQVVLENPPPSLACAQEFSAFMALTCQIAPVNTWSTASLIAQLINPQANDVVFDFVCGTGQPLLACAVQLARTQPDAVLHLLGMEENHDDWALAKMMLSLSGQPNHAIAHRNVLTESFKNLSAQEQKLMLGGVDVVLMVVPAQSSHWGHALAWEENDPRFKARPPIDTRLALAWLGLAAMNPHGGRMALLMPTNAFLALGSMELRQHMVDLNWLDAVITLPGITGYVLLMLHSQKTQAHIGFIQTRCPITSDTDEGIHAVLNAWQRYQTGATHPCVVRIERTVVASHQYELDRRRYEGQLHGSPNFPN